MINMQTIQALETYAYHKKQDPIKDKLKLWGDIGNQVNSPKLEYVEHEDYLLQIFKLIKTCYEKKKFISEKHASEPYYYNYYTLLPDTAHCVCMEQEDIISSVSLAFDDAAHGLPMDIVYNNELRDLRNNNKRLVEVTFLATDMRYQKNNIFHYLVQTVFWYLLSRDIDYICITVHPKQASFYKRFFGFENIGGEKIYPRVDKKAVALTLDIAKNRSEMFKICTMLNFEEKILRFLKRLNAPCDASGKYFVKILQNALSYLDFTKMAARLEPDQHLSEAEIDRLHSLYLQRQIL